VAQPYRSLVLDQVGSTNREALALAACGETGPLWIMARRQTAGRGRGSRQWASVPGNLHASLLTELACTPAVTPQLALLAGVATLDAIREAAPGGPAELRLKWPNDVLIGGAKCAGILVETTGAPRPRSDSPPPCGEGLGVGGTSTFDVLQSPPPCPSPTRGEGTPRRAPSPISVTAVLGIGINLAWHPTDLGRAATHLAEHGPSVAPERMLRHLAEAVQHWLAAWRCGADFATIRAAWLERASPAGAPLSVDTGAERIAGAFVDLDPQGGLVVLDSQGRHRTVTFGDVALVTATPQDARR
jgi:BirA family transcriptional regulator, biotin operon repressor / biotin---[acetyl-CoA-carboxylase] ligase